MIHVLGMLAKDCESHRACGMYLIPFSDLDKLHLPSANAIFFLTSLAASCNAACQGTKMMCTLLVRIVEHDHQQLIFLLKMGTVNIYYMGIYIYMCVCV